MKNSKIFDFNLPPGAILRGRLYRDPETRYPSGQVIDIDLPGGTTINLGWDEGYSYEYNSYDFLIQVFTGHFDIHLIDCRVPDPEKAAALIQILIDQFARTTAQPTH
jgi:hypothetical protein